MRQTRRRGLWFFGLLALCIAGYFGWTALGTDSAVSGASTTLLRVERGELIVKAEATGKIEPHSQVEVKSRAPGEVLEILVREGEAVAAGQRLARLDPTAIALAVRNAEVSVRRLRAQLAETRAGYAVAETEAEEADKVAVVQRKGAELGVVASENERSASATASVKRKQLELRRAQIAAAQAQLQAAELALQDAQRQLGETEIHAPFAGTILSVHIERGSIASSALTNVGGGTTLFTLADLSDLRVIGKIDEAQVGRVKVGQDVAIRVDAYPERVFQGRVERVSPLGVEVSNVVSFDVEIIVTDPKAQLLRSGMSADLEIVTAVRKDVVLVPLTAVRSEGGKRFVRLPDGELRGIRTGENDGTQIEVLEGVAEGQTIASGGASSAPARSGGGAGVTRGLFGPPSRR